MAKVLIITGPTSSGKSRMANDWVSQSPGTRRQVGSLGDARVALRSGLDIVMVPEEFTGHEVTHVNLEGPSLS